MVVVMNVMIVVVLVTCLPTIAITVSMQLREVLARRSISVLHHSGRSSGGSRVWKIPATTHRWLPNKYLASKVLGTVCTTAHFTSSLRQISRILGHKLVSVSLVVLKRAPFIDSVLRELYGATSKRRGGNILFLV